MAEHSKVVVLTPSALHKPSDLSADDWYAAVTAAAKQWSFPQVSCTGLQLRVGLPVDLRSAALDGINLLAFRSERWCHNSRCGPERTFPRRVTGVTTTYPEGARGAEVIEADVELNAVNFKWWVGHAPDSREGVPSVDLVAALTHEIGHVLGLEDVCGGHMGKPPAQSCSELNSTSVMFAPAMNRVLSARDVDELCKLHPRRPALPTGKDARGSHCDCAMMHQQPEPMMIALLTCVAAIWLLRRASGWITR